MKVPLWATLMAVTSLSSAASTFGLARLFDLANLQFGYGSEEKSGAGSNDDLPQEKCYPSLGCVRITEEWYDSIYRPVNFLPQDRGDVNTQFKLYTRDADERELHWEEYLVSDDNGTIASSHFSKDRRIVFIVHGFLDGPDVPWVQVTGNTRLVALEIVKLIEVIQELTDVETASIHLIGHSLGAHICGYVGEQVRGVSRITGLDPAEPYFQGMPEFVRLDPTDANFVDVIHSDGNSILALGLGLWEPCGHVDFYPNDGREQPGCEISQVGIEDLYEDLDDGLMEVGRRAFACSHTRAVLYFTESLESTSCPYLGHRCDTYSGFLKGECDRCDGDGTSCVRMGIHADHVLPSLGNRTELGYYLDTGKVEPFCRHHYRIVVETRKTDDAEKWLKGSIELQLFGSQEDRLSTTHPIQVVTGEPTSFLLTSERRVPDVVLVSLSWSYQSDILDLGSLCLFWCDYSLDVESISITEMDNHSHSTPLTARLCSREEKKYTNVPSDNSNIFTASACSDVDSNDAYRGSWRGMTAQDVGVDSNIIHHDRRSL